MANKSSLSSALKTLTFTAEACLVAALAMFFTVWNIGENSYGVGDQSIHARVIQEMLHTGQWWTPHLDGRPYFNKPPLKMWLTLPILHFFGQSNFTFRIFDGVLGAILVAMTYVIGWRMFRSRVVGAFSALALVGCDSFLFSHGVRESVQDSLLYVFLTAAIMIGYAFCNTESTASRRLFWLSLSGGTLVGLAFMTKHAAAVIAPLVIGIYALLSGTAIEVFRSKKRYLGLALLPLLGIPAMWLVPQMLESRGLFNVMFNHEIYKRGTVGYHHLNHTWYYPFRIFVRRVTVPPELLSLGLVLGLIGVLRHRDTRYALLLAWAIAPVVLFQSFKSKLFWYISPALPAFAILCGVSVHFLWERGRIGQRQWSWSSCRQKFTTIIVALAFSASLILLAFNLVKEARQIYTTQPVTLLDRVTRDALRAEKLLNQDLRTLVYFPTKLNDNEKLYAGMLGSTLLETPEQLFEELQSPDIAYSLFPLELFTRVARETEVTAYGFVRPTVFRRTWLVVTTSLPASTIPTLIPAKQQLRFADKHFQAIFGWKEAQPFHDRRIRLSKGPRSAMIVVGDYAKKSLPTRLSVNFASTHKDNTGGVRTVVTLNGQLLGEVDITSHGFNEYSFDIPPGYWMSGNNIFMFSSTFLNQKEIAPAQELLLFDYLTISLLPRLEAETTP